jgi:hypothetical protein
MGLQFRTGHPYPTPLVSYHSAQPGGRRRTWIWNANGKWLSAIPAGCNPPEPEQAVAAAATAGYLFSALIHGDISAIRRALEHGTFVMSKNRLLTALHPFG